MTSLKLVIYSMVLLALFVLISGFDKRECQCRISVQKRIVGGKMSLSNQKKVFCEKLANHFS